MGLNRRALFRWLRLLESGEFKQGQGALKIVPKTRKAKVKHCCLGVACELYSVTVGGFWEDEPYVRGESACETEPDFIADYPTHSGEPDKDGSFLPHAVANWLGLTQRQQEKLAALNDDGFSFAQIAAYIRYQLRRYGTSDDWETGHEYRSRTGIRPARPQ